MASRVMLTIGCYFDSYTSPQIAQRPITRFLVNLRKSHVATSLYLSTGDKNEDLGKERGRHSSPAPYLYPKEEG